MKTPVEISTTLTPWEAKALLTELRIQYRLTFNEVWYDDRYRLIPEGLRHDSILADSPLMTAQKRLIGALKHSLDEVK
ncbi:hypothetical protein HX870_24440 [Pseudomonas gingeri]|uniref:hypothetical protein n=1 Tax=Pseudomonas gingeri TaxID=117681 RepID=UPI0015A16062|nr:hypothetical protein [Pseudomonas gingeri]NWD70752.1 hypothetical protein [Pseudomonas gingeri]